MLSLACEFNLTQKRRYPQVQAEACRSMPQHAAACRSMPQHAAAPEIFPRDRTSLPWTHCLNTFLSDMHFPPATPSFLSAGSATHLAACLSSGASRHGIVFGFFVLQLKHQEFGGCNRVNYATMQPCDILPRLPELALGCLMGHISILGVSFGLEDLHISSINCVVFGDRALPPPPPPTFAIHCRAVVRLDIAGAMTDSHVMWGPLIAKHPLLHGPLCHPIPPCAPWWGSLSVPSLLDKPGVACATLAGMTTARGPSTRLAGPKGSTASAGWIAVSEV